ncbi:MAG: DUF1294 domain-containing protein [Thiotrichales bacterium]|nr:DUF1294 domain-containing protein [Thiotrichales bacterium]
MRYKGHIKIWHEDKGFGFIKSIDNKSDLFVHVSGFKNRSAIPQPDEEVSFIISRDHRGRVFADRVLRRIDKAPTTSNARTISIFCVIVFILYSVVVVTKLPLESGALILGMYSFLSFVTYKIYQFDKQSAMDQSRRVPERALHFLSLMGGWPGALLAQEILRHKSRKHPFKTILWITILVNFVILFYVILQIK